jgi:GTPase SAR1 family protein
MTSIQSIINDGTLNSAKKLEAIKHLFNVFPVTPQQAPQPVPQEHPNTDIHVGSTLKIVLIGDGGVGKTSYISRLQNTHCDKFMQKYIKTLGVNVEPVRLPEFPYTFNFWDCAGDPQYTGLGDGYYVQADACIIMYTEDNQIDYWIQQFRRVCPKKPYCVVPQ